MVASVGRQVIKKTQVRQVTIYERLAATTVVALTHNSTDFPGGY